MRVFVFGSRNLTAVHVDAMRQHLERVAQGLPAEEKLVLIHGSGPPGKEPGAIGADRLSEVAAHLAWRGRPRAVRRFPVKPEAGESWPQAAARRDVAMASTEHELALCFHTDVRLGRGSAITAQALEQRKPAGQRYLLVLLRSDGSVAMEEQR